MTLIVEKRNFFDRLFPPKYDFFEKLANQAQINGAGIAALKSWLESGSDGDTQILNQCRDQADKVRLGLEKDLVSAFSTPIERGDIYLFSVNMDKIIEYTLSTYLSMKDFDVDADNIIMDMSVQLKAGADLFLEAVKNLRDNPQKSEQLIPDIRKTHALIEQLYRDGMSSLFHCDDPMRALKLREVYHHIKDASSNLDYSVDTLHKIIVGLT